MGYPRTDTWYVGYHLNDTFISCPKCDEICSDEEMPVEKRQVVDISDDEIPF